MGQQLPPQISCRQLTVFGAPRLSSWWKATSTWSKAIFITRIGVPPSQILILSMSLIVQLLDNLRLLVNSFFGFEAPNVLIFNNQHQLSRYLLIPLRLLIVLIDIKDPQSFQVLLIDEKQALRRSWIGTC